MEDSVYLHQPKYVLRGHAAAIHALSFAPDNSRLLTGDADGWVICWSLAYKRPLASWRAHENAVLGLNWWGPEAIISHGRDSKLLAWRLREQDEAVAGKALPVDTLATENAKPEVLCNLTLNTMNFCSFTSVLDPLSIGAVSATTDGQEPLLLAVPHTLDSEAIDIFQLPTSRRLGTVPPPSSIKAGMAMALQLRALNDVTYLAAGYESGHVLYYRNSSRTTTSNRAASNFGSSGEGINHLRSAIFTDDWQCVYLSKPHSQPILSLLPSLDYNHMISSSADSVIALHAFASLLVERWDEDGAIEAGRAVEDPVKVTRAGDPGQQGLSTGWDGTLFAVAGWDGKSRVYDWKSLQRRYMLEWHREGVYATAVAHKARSNGDSQSYKTENPELTSALEHVQSKAMTASRPRKGALAARREQQAQRTFWIAVGGKDSKVSLWDIGQ